MPMATPDTRSNGISFLIFAKGSFCFVTSKNTAIIRAAKTARYKANSPEETGIFLTKILNVPNVVLEAIIIKRGFKNFFIGIPFKLLLLVLFAAMSFIDNQKIASGGELSRFMLALKVNLAQTSSISTMIFDEVDAGIGGAVAQAVGERLARLGREVQVLVVTHAPQVAALGSYHFKVAKHTQNDITTTTVYKLSQTDRQEEIARMLAGEIITDEARAAALKLMK